MTHPVLTEHPAIVALDQEIAELAAAEDASRQRVAALLEPYHAAVKAWKAESDAAILAGNEPPARPAPPDLGRDEHAANLFLRERSALQRRRRETLAEIAGDIEQSAHRRERELVDACAPLIAELAEHASEWTALLAAVRNVRQAQDTTGDERVIPPRTARMRSRVDVAAVVEITSARGSALDVSPLPGRPVPVPEPAPRPLLPVSNRGVLP